MIFSERFSIPWTRSNSIIASSFFFAFCAALTALILWTPVEPYAKALYHETCGEKAIISKNDNFYYWLEKELEYSNILQEKGFETLLETVVIGSQKGDPYSHYVLGALFSLESDQDMNVSDELDHQSLAVLHYTIAAQQDDFNSLLALAYRHECGYGVPVDCIVSARLYGKVAKKIVEVAVDESIIPSVEALTLEDGNKSSSGNANLLQYGELQAAQGSGKFHLAIGYTYLFGILGQKQNGVHAHSHFLHALRQGHQAAAYGALGQLYSKGAPGIGQNVTAAFEYFLAGAQEGDVSSLNGLGTFFAKGIVVQRNVTKAVHYFNLSAFHGNPEAHYNLGVVYLNGVEDILDIERAKHHLSLASEKGMLLARCTLGSLYENGVGVDRSCAKAIDLYKGVLKEGPRDRRMTRAHDLYRSGSISAALYNYLLSAENGQPEAELNLGTLIERHTRSMRVPKLTVSQIKYYTRSASQGTRHALVRMGDILYQESKKATECKKENRKNSQECILFQHLEKYAPYSDLSAWAAQYYREAEVKRSSYAAYSLGWMYHFGSESFDQDDTQAKRYYDLAIEYNPSASISMNFLLALLFVKQTLAPRWTTILVEMPKQLLTILISFIIRRKLPDLICSLLIIGAFIFIRRRYNIDIHRNT